MTNLSSLEKHQQFPGPYVGISRIFILAPGVNISNAHFSNPSQKLLKTYAIQLPDLDKKWDWNCFLLMDHKCLVLLV